MTKQHVVSKQGVTITLSDFAADMLADRERGDKVAISVLNGLPPGKPQ